MKSTAEDQKVYKDQIPGGKADEMQPTQFDPLQLSKGLKIEMEHTDNPWLALEIAMDHLFENPKYYDYLEEMEKQAGIATAIVKKCTQDDAKPGRPWCIYKHEKSTKDQPKGWPKTYESKEDADKALKMMHVFGDTMITKAELKMVLSSLGVNITADETVSVKELQQALAKESKKSLRPPKKWWNKMEKEIKQANPSYSEEKVAQTIGDIWYNKLSDAKRKEIREREGKEYGPAED